jgi:uncharacterized protein with HEPN domain
MARPGRTDRDAAYLDDIRESCGLIQAYVKGKSFADFVADRALQDAVVLRLTVIGEAAKSLSVQAKAAHPRITWRDIGRFRDLAVHHYWKVDANLVWGIAKNDIPALLKALSTARS